MDPLGPMEARPTFDQIDHQIDHQIDQIDHPINDHPINDHPINDHPIEIEIEIEIQSHGALIMGPKGALIMDF